MENEISASTHIMIELLVIGIVVTFLMIFVQTGDAFGKSIVNQVADTQAATFMVELKEAEEYGAIPTPAVYLMLEKNQRDIRSISGSPYGVDVQRVEDLVPLFGEKVKLEVTKNMEMLDIVILSP